VSVADEGARRLLGLQPIDRDGWPPGPWDDEGDYYAWEHAGLLCLISRIDFGPLCGYAGVARGSPLHGLGYDAPALEEVSAHGGLTFAGRREDHGGGGRWFFGFDCCHGGDEQPKNSDTRFAVRGHEPVYRTVGYVRAETRRLAEQLSTLEAKLCG
jgi:hypothetical protein